MSPEAPPPVFLGVALAAALLMSLAVLRWGRRGALWGYGTGLVVCFAAWVGAVFLTTRLNGPAPTALGPALGRGLAAMAVLASLWLAVASTGALAGALGRLVWKRLRRRRARTMRRPSVADRTARRRRSRG